MTHDTVNHPKHYTEHPSGIECIQITEHMGFNLGNAFKYLFRHEHKNSSVEDLRKAVWYIERELLRMERETWRVYPRDNRYEISSLGNVRMVGNATNRALVPLKSGYLTFMTAVDGRNMLHYVHRAVCETFICPIPKGHVVSHTDGNKKNNNACNLRIGTQKQNMMDRRIHGTHFYGERNPAAKLTVEEVAEIRSLSQYTPPAELSVMYGVSRATIQRLQKGESWADPRLEFFMLLERIVESDPNQEISAAMDFVARAKWSASAVEDLKKAAWYINRELARRGNNADTGK